MFYVTLCGRVLKTVGIRSNVINHGSFIHMEEPLRWFYQQRCRCGSRIRGLRGASGNGELYGPWNQEIEVGLSAEFLVENKIVFADGTCQWTFS